MNNLQYGDLCSVETGMTVTTVLLILIPVSILGLILARKLLTIARARLLAARSSDVFAYTREQYLREQNGIIGGSAEEIAAHQKMTDVTTVSE
jgi:hypothetical protein